MSRSASRSTVVWVLALLVLTLSACSSYRPYVPDASTEVAPARVTATLAHIDAGDWPAAAHAPGTKGGTTFRNNEGHLPRTDAHGAPITYREWDVNPKQPGQSRDAERIVTGSDGSAWYTDDHYQSFVMIRGPSS
ncbi:ribonuclease domain-containing protein [Gordonia sp. CPCC 205515]